MSQGSTGCCRKDTFKGCISLYFFALLLPPPLSFFSLILVRFASVSFLFRFCFASAFNVSLKCELSEKNYFFFRFEAKKVLLPFRLENEN
jgi:hypothetical protein